MLRRAAVQLGVAGIAEAQLDAGADLVFHCRPDLRPARGGQHDVHPVRQSSRRKCGDRQFQCVEFATQAGPPVDHQEHVAVLVVRNARISGCPSAPVIGHRVDPQPPKRLFPSPQQPGHLGDGPAHQVRIRGRCHRTDMREGRERRERATAEVQAIQLHLFGCVGAGQRGNQRPDRGGLARLRRSDDRDMACRPGQLDDQGVTTLVERPVDKTDRNRQQTATVTEQSIQRGRLGQRWQPHPVRRCAASGQSVEHRVQDRLAGGDGGSVRFSCSTVAGRSREHSHHGRRGCGRGRRRHCTWTRHV